MVLVGSISSPALKAAIEASYSRWPWSADPLREYPFEKDGLSLIVCEVEQFGRASKGSARAFSDRQRTGTANGSRD